MRVGPELELRYFEILSKVLHYHRMKLSEEYSKIQGKVSMLVLRYLFNLYTHLVLNNLLI